MIKNIKLKFGRAPGAESIIINTTPITVFVGPNNSGKSQVLLEIARYCSSGNHTTNDVIIDHIEFDTFDRLVAEDKIGKITLRPNHNESVPTNHILVGKKGTRMQVHKESILNAFLNPNSQAQQFCQFYLAHNTIILNGQNRISLINAQNAGDLQQAPQASFQILLRDNAKREVLRRIINEAFSSYIVIDPTHLGHLRLRLSKRAPKNEIEERGIHDEAIQFHANATPIEQASDGVKAFTGMITEMIAGDPTVLLVDEPEAFLHPALSFQLGKEISKATIESEKRLFVSTHSPNFVMGCIQSGAPVNIIRLTYRDNVPTARILPNSELSRLMRNPLLRSTGVLAGLFYEFVVVTESDTDRAFYQEINERLLRYMPEKGIPNCLFINAQNKQTIKTIIKPLRELGIPVAGIVDIDVLKEGGIVWSSFLESGYLPELERNSLAGLRSTLKQKFDVIGKDMKKDGGVNLLIPEDKEAATNLLEKLCEYGLFVVHGGELESWLSNLEVSGHGPDWLINIFEKMGEDTESPIYIKPTVSDVWNFIGEIKKWLINPKRKGIPV
ncbi:MAG TPA: ATP-dependent nuclease [Candidatus Wunengus sp. YC65]|uniref:ATP-dependent nuclease n=1 Tax=Candidatus Wunengus sp. YC65 TaxID=3367701 RepID=UPI00402638B9